MRFLVDECVGPSVVRWLREQTAAAHPAAELRGMQGAVARLNEIC